MISRALVSAFVLASGSCGSASAANISPPMLDITRQCEAGSRHNATAMSECIVAESEARSELLQNWTKYSDDSAERCVKLGRKTRRLPYSAMAKCMSAEGDRGLRP